MSMRKFLRTVFLVDLLEGLGVTFRYQPTKNICHGAVSRGETQDRRAISRRAAAEQPSGDRRDAVYRLQPVRGRLSGDPDRGGQRAQREDPAQGADDFHVRHVTLHVLRAVRGRLSGGRAGADAGFRDWQATPGKARSGTGRCWRKVPSQTGISTEPEPGIPAPTVRRRVAGTGHAPSGLTDFDD